MSMFGGKFGIGSSNKAPESSGVTLTKGNKLVLEKNGDSIQVKNGWSAKGKDYDLKALVRYKDGRLIYVGAANADEVLSTPEGAVVHSGDAVNAGEVETLTIKHHPDIASIAVSSYSALENGSGSFKQYGVYVEIVNGSQVFKINAADASASSSSYTLCFGEITMNDDGTLAVENLDEAVVGGFSGSREVARHLPCIGPEIPPRETNSL